MKLGTSRYRIVTAEADMITAVTDAPHFHHFLEWFDRQRENVADAALGLDHARRTGIDFQFPPQPQHLDIDASIENIFVNTRGLQQSLP